MKNWRKFLEEEEVSRFALNFKASEWEVDIPASYEEVIEHIVLAQVSSDGGKWIPRFKGLNSLTEEAYRKGYDVKDDHILSAILGILSLECQDYVTFFIASDWEVYGANNESMDSIIYFEWKGYQISFHSFNPIWKKVHDLFGSEETLWDMGSSPYTCLQMIAFLQECGKKEWAKESEIEALFQFADYEDDRMEDVISVHRVCGVTARMYDSTIGVHKNYVMVEVYNQSPFFVFY